MGTICPLQLVLTVIGKFYLINAPWGFATVWSVIKRWLDPVTVEKISILGSSYQAELLKQIPKENLPSKFGGECRCPGGCELSDAGPWQDPQWLGPQGQTTKAAAAPATSDEVGSSSTEPIVSAESDAPSTTGGEITHAA